MVGPRKFGNVTLVIDDNSMIQGLGYWSLLVLVGDNGLGKGFGTRAGYKGWVQGPGSRIWPK